MKPITLIMLGLLLMTSEVFAGIGNPPPFNVTRQLSVDGKPFIISANSDTPAYLGAGWGTSPSILSSNGKNVFVIDVGSGGTATMGTLVLGTYATNKWVCLAMNKSTTLTHMVVVDVNGQAVSIQNINVTTGAALAWAANAKINVICFNT